MKIRKLVNATLAASLLLAGCSSSESTAKEEDGKYILASIDGTSFYADDFYDYVLNTESGVELLYETILLQIINDECPVNDDMEAELETLQETYQEYIDAGYEETLLESIQSYGYATLDDYYEGYLQYLQIVDFFNNYLEENYDEVFEEYYEIESPKKVYHILIAMDDPDNPTEEEQAKLDEVQKLLDMGKDFQETAIAYSDDTTAEDGGYLGICGNSSSFVDEFMEVMETLEPGTISAAFKTDYGYHFMYIEDVTKEDIKEELDDPDSVLRDWESDDFYDSYLEYVVFNSYDIDYGDDVIQEKMEEFIAERLEEREEALFGTSDDDSSDETSE